MADHTVYQVKVQFSLHPEQPTQCLGEAIWYREPGDSAWTLLEDQAHGPNPLKWCLDVATERVMRRAGSLPPALPFR